MCVVVRVGCDGGVGCVGACVFVWVSYHVAECDCVGPQCTFACHECCEVAMHEVVA